MADKLAAVSRQLNALADRLEADGLQESNRQRRARIAYDYAVEAGRCLVDARKLGAFDREAPFVAKTWSYEPGHPSEQQEIPTDIASLFQGALRDDRDEKDNFNEVFCALWRHWLPTKDNKFEYRRFQRPRLDLTYANYMRAFAEIFKASKPIPKLPSSKQIAKVRDAIAIVGKSATPKMVLSRMKHDDPAGEGMREQPFRACLKVLTERGEFNGNERTRKAKG